MRKPPPSGGFLFLRRLHLLAEVFWRVWICIRHAFFYPEFGGNKKPAAADAASSGSPPSSGRSGWLWTPGGRCLGGRRRDRGDDAFAGGVATVTSVETGPSWIATTSPSMQLRAEIFKGISCERCVCCAAPVHSARTSEVINGPCDVRELLQKGRQRCRSR